MSLLHRIGMLTLLFSLLAACSGTPTPPSPTAAPTTAAAPTVAAPTAMPADMAMAPTTAPAGKPLKIVASTSWVAAFAKAAGATDITVIAPANVQHPPDYDPKPSDLVAISGADYVLLAGFEGFAKRMQEAVGGDSKKLITVNTENSPEALHTEITKLGELFGTQDQAKAYLADFDTQYAKLSGEVKAKLGSNTPVVVAQAFVVPWVIFAGLQPAGTYGPMPLGPDDLKKLADLKPTVVFENYHMGGGQPVVEATGAKKIDLLNFPGDDLDLLKVFTTNAQRIEAALGGAATAVASYPVMIENCGRKLTFDKAPTRVVSLWQPPNELLLALGLQDNIIALAGNYTDLRPDLAPLAAKIKIIGTSMQWPSKEVLLSEKPDLVISEGLEGFMYDTSQGYPSVAEIEATGAKVLSTGGSCTPSDPKTQSKTTQQVYDDLLMLGKVFGVSDRAEALIKQLQDRESVIVAKVAGKSPVKVAFYNGGEGPVNVLTFGIWADLMRKAGGQDVITASGYQVSNEEFAAGQPDVILVGFFPGQDPKDSIAFLKKTFPNIPAVQNDRLVPIPTIDTEASVRVVDGLEEIAKALHPEAFTATDAMVMAANPFDVSVAQFELDSAGFHGMATVLSDTKKIDPSYLSKVTRVAKILKQTTWPATLNEQAQTFIVALDTFATALKDNNVPDAVKASDTVHDQQHELSHAIDEWIASKPALTAAADPFNVSVAQFYLDSAGFHDMSTVLSDTKKIDTSYLSKVTRVAKVLKQTTWPASLNEQAQTFIAALDAFATALQDNNVPDAITASDTVHDAQHELSHAIDGWIASKPALAKAEDPFKVSVAQFYLDSAGFHDMSTVLSDTKKIDTSYFSKVTRVAKVLKQTTWPTSLNEQAQTFIVSLDTFATALKDNKVPDAIKTSDTVHDQQHELSHEIDAWYGTMAMSH